VRYVVIEDSKVVEEYLESLHESLLEEIKKEFWFADIEGSDINDNPFYPYWVMVRLKLRDKAFSDYEETKIKRIARKFRCTYKFNVFIRKEDLVLEVWFYPKSVP
jgi:hypothetical protein